jgi:DNA-binding MarR family transcriptional regulator
MGVTIMATNIQLEEMFLRKKPARLLVHIKQADTDSYASNLAKKIDCTYAHTVKLLQKMQEHGLVEFNKDGRVKYISLTENGQNLATDFENLLFKSLAIKADAVVKEGE